MIIKLEISRFTRKYTLVNVNEAVKLMNKDDTIIVDVREDKEITDGVIKGSQHITLGQLSDKIGLLGANKEAPVLVYCRTGSRALSAGHTLTKAGFGNVSTLTGGILAWETANLPTVAR